jgi:8-amino-7-oxononanoate synthase
MATLGKAAGVAGAFVAGDEALIEWLLQKTRSYIFATAAPALLAEALRASVRLIERDEWRRVHLQRLIVRLRAGLSDEVLPHAAHWRLLPSETPIQPLILGANEEALEVMGALRAHGFWVPAIRPPTVPEGSARLRIALNAAHSEVDVERLVSALRKSAQGAN